MMEIKILDKTGSFAENKDVARELRLKIMLVLKKENVTLDFDGVEGATQSFIHALISDIIREYGSNILDKIYFKNCNEMIKKIISIVADYMQES